MGARVIAVARGADKLAAAAQAGAAICLDSGSDGFDLRAELKALGGAHVIYDAIGEPLATPALRALHPEGRFLAIGFAGGTAPAFPANILLVKNLSVIGLYWGGYARFAPQIMAGSIATLFDWYAAGDLRPHISHVLPLERATEGLELAAHAARHRQDCHHDLSRQLAILSKTHAEAPVLLENGAACKYLQVKVLCTASFANGGFNGRFQHDARAGQRRSR